MSIYHSQLLKRDIAQPTEAAFLRAAAKEHLRWIASSLVRRGNIRRSERSPESTRKNYDRDRQGLDLADVDEFVLGSNASDFILRGGKVVFDSPRGATEIRMDVLLDRVSRYARGAPIVEFGAGYGRNLVHLGLNGVPGQLIGLELSPVSVDVARKHADRFGQAIDFKPCDVTAPSAIEDLETPDVVFTVHALEMMPRVFRGALDNIRSLRPRAAIFFEPIEELWPHSVRGLLSRLRVRQLDRLRGLMAEVADLGRIVEVRALGDATNPLNETALVVVEIRP